MFGLGYLCVRTVLVETRFVTMETSIILRIMVAKGFTIGITAEFPFVNQN